MAKNAMNFVKGMGMGLVAGGIAGAVGYNYVRQNKRGMKKKVGKALRNVSDLVENVNEMF